MRPKSKTLTGTPLSRSQWLPNTAQRLPFSRRERAGRCFSKTNDLAREAVGCNGNPLGRESIAPCVPLHTASLLLAVSVHSYHTLNPTLIAGLTARMPERKREVQVVGQAVHFRHIGDIETDGNRPQRVVC